jgi:hypothetical protein
MYVSIKPAIIFESDPAEPKVKRNPRKQNASKMGESLPGR